jgi:hypothetical protein
VVRTAWPFNRLRTPRTVLSNKKSARDFYVTQQAFLLHTGGDPDKAREVFATRRATSGANDVSRCKPLMSDLMILN